MTEWEVVVRGVAALLALYALVHLLWAGSNSEYFGLDFFTGADPDRPGWRSYIHVAILWLGCTVFCIGAASTLTAWMPYEWGAEIEGEFQHTKERTSQLLGGFLGLGCVAFLSAANRKTDKEAQLVSEARDEVRREFQQASRLEADAVRAKDQERIRAVAEANRKRADEQRAETLRLLRLMTDEELDEVWNCRPLISWTEPLNSMSANEQRQYWAKHLLHRTSWEFPESLLSAVRDRHPKVRS